MGDGDTGAARGSRRATRRPATTWAMMMPGLGLVLTACSAPAALHAAAPGGPAISNLQFDPDHARAGCRVVLRFHFESGGDAAPAVTTWALMRGDPLRPDGEDALRAAGSGSLGGRRSGEAAIPFMFPDAGDYRYYVQVEDGAARWSNALDARVVVAARRRGVSPACPTAPEP